MAGRTPPMNKAKQRAVSMQKEMEIQSTGDAGMDATLNQERARRVAFKKAGEATAYPSNESVTPKKKKKGLLQTLTEGFKNLTNPTAKSDAQIAALKPKIAERHEQAMGARKLKQRGY